ncbi:MAG: pilus assembly protein [Bosea sp.]|uniref:TadE/TadG family type IV pilus assembly protein n=1 Tax=Bosea sp. (in: a-proteobacteria) TaxID=1871050 RepID=UPI00238A9EC9|nr:pilus assembly protein [Bosea sp. (in: a-proteobacteria)]MCP4739772.1 pilus assembly protein [Bosea sp. (in: a-proteobacteria)]
MNFFSPVRVDARRTKRGGILTAFARDRNGATAIEFGMIALPFLALIGGVFDLGMTMWARASLQDAVTSASRQIYTGSFQQSNAGTSDSAALLANFHTELCKQTGITAVSLFNCSDVKISVRQVGSMRGAKLNQASSSAGGWNQNFSGYTSGSPGNIMVIQAAIEFPILFNLLGADQVSNGFRIIQGTAVLKVEPYGGKSS